MVDHVQREKDEHYTLWDEVQIIDRERFWKMRKIKEAAHNKMSEKCISQFCTEFNFVTSTNQQKQWIQNEVL